MICSSSKTSQRTCISLSSSMVPPCFPLPTTTTECNHYFTTMPEQKENKDSMPLPKASSLQRRRRMSSIVGDDVSSDGSAAALLLGLAHRGQQQQQIPKVEKAVSPKFTGSKGPLYAPPSLISVPLSVSAEGDTNQEGHNIIYEGGSPALSPLTAGCRPIFPILPPINTQLLNYNDYHDGSQKKKRQKLSTACFRGQPLAPAPMLPTNVRVGEAVSVVVAASNATATTNSSSKKRKQ